MKRWLKLSLIGVGGLLGLVGTTGGVYAWVTTSAYEASMSRVYDVPVPELSRSTDPEVIARGKHLAESVASCAGADCHGADLGGGKTLEMGPLGDITGPNISAAGLGAAYSDGELARLVRHGIKKDGRSVRFMPSHEINWLPDDDLVAIISYIRTLPPVQKRNGPLRIGLLGKILDRKDAIVVDVARRIDHQRIETAPLPSPDAEYGRFLGRLCTGCHGERLSGGRIPGTPSSFPVPSNLTPHETGLAGWTYEDFDRLLTKGLRKNGKELDPFMPIDDFGKCDETEKRALWAYLQTLPPLELGNR